MESEPSEPQGGALSALIESTTRTKPVATGQLVVPRPPPVVMRTVEELVGFPDTVALPLAPDSSQPLCGAVSASPGEIIPERSWVAAWLDSDWILAMVLRHKSLTNKYVVLDIDPPVDRDRPPSSTIQAANLLQLPTSEPMIFTHKNEIRRGEMVLALYPHTTCFYQGRVHTPPSQNGPLDRQRRTYLVQFANSENKTGYTKPIEVPLRYVLRSIASAANES
jgi:hypothetical protein